jgi:RNA recognition motif-containing protein
MSFVCPVSVQSRSLWIGEIENWMDENYISNNFAHYGYKVKSVKIIRDKSTKTVVGYGFVEFFTPEIAKEVLQNLNGKLIPNSEKTFKLNAATYSAGKVASMGNFPKNEFSIYVGDLDSSVTEEKLKEFFEEKYKSVVSAKIVVDNITKMGKGYGFVKFSNQAESIKAINEMNGKYLCGRPIKAK